MNTLPPLRTAGLALLALALSACLDTPISGEVAGEAMGWTSTVLVLTEPLVAPAASSLVDLSAPSVQLMISDKLATCVGASELLTLGEGEHTLAINLQPLDSETLEAGQYEIGGRERGVGTASATFLYSRAGATLREDAIGGSISLSRVDATNVSGRLELEFPSGALTGILSGDVCAAAAP